MKLAARCPACGTVFRVVPDQLKISDGWVRCGYCSEVFDARSHFLDPDVLQAEGQPGPAAPSVPGTASAATSAALAAPDMAAQAPPSTPTPSSTPTVRARTEEQIPSPAQVSDTAAALPPPETLPPEKESAPSSGLEPAAGLPAVEEPSAHALVRATSSLPAAAAASGAAGDATGTSPALPPGDAATPLISAGLVLKRPSASGPSAEAMPEPAFVAEPPDSAFTPLEPLELHEAGPGEPAQSALTSAGEPILLESSPTEALAPPVDDAPRPDARTEPEAPRERLLRAAPADMAPQDDEGAGITFQTSRFMPEEPPAFVRRAERRAFWQRPAVRLYGGLVLLLLAAILALQLMRLYHDALAARFPGLRIPLTAICRPLGCTVADLRRIDDIAIDNAAFQRLSSNTYSLALTLRNRGTLPIAVPWVELNLTDADGRTLVRRVLSPAELGVKPAALAAGEERNAQARFTVEMAGIAGYRVLAFYP